VKSLEQRLHKVVDARAVSWEPRGGGYSTAERYSVLLDDGRRVFVKAADAEHLAAWLRREHEVYAHLAGSFIPQLVGFDDDGARPLLVLEDLSHGDWHPVWTSARVETVRAALSELADAAPPPSTAPVRETFAQLFGRWREVEEDPMPFLSLGLRSQEWLAARLPTIISAADAAPVDGTALLHLDVRSDNLCVVDGRAKLVDWNWTSLGNPDVDVAGWLPSLAVEGGPQPWEVLAGAGELAAWIAGVWAAVAGLPPPVTAPTVREVQRTQLAVALDWIDRELF